MSTQQKPTMIFKCNKNERTWKYRKKTLTCEGNHHPTYYKWYPSTFFDWLNCAQASKP